MERIKRKVEILEKSVEQINIMYESLEKRDKNIKRIFKDTIDIINRYDKKSSKKDAYVNAVLNEYSKINIRMIKKIIDTDNEKLYKVYDYINKYTIEQLEFNKVYTNFIIDYQINDYYDFLVSNSYRKLLQVLSVSFKESNKKTPEEIVDKSVIKSIQDRAKYIVKRLNEINKKAELLGKDLPIKLTTTTTEIMCFLSDMIVDNEDNYIRFINSLYRLLYENRKRLVGESSELEFINVIRRYYLHDLDHGDKGKFKKKLKELNDLNVSLIGKSMPTTTKEWQKLQLSIYDLIIKVIDNIQINEE